MAGSATAISGIGSKFHASQRGNAPNIILCRSFLFHASDAQYASFAARF
jgi:hypothetical protein